MQGYNEDYLEVVETPVNKQDKYFYQIIQRLDKIIELLSEEAVNDNYDEDIDVVSDYNMEEIVPDYNYDEMTVKELRDIAKNKGLSGYSVLNKNELIETLVECGD